MIARIHKSMQEKDKGFTLIELLVVMIIIGILAAIAIPVFLNQRKKAAETSAKADVSTIGKEAAAYYVDGLGTLSIATTAGTPSKWTLTSNDTPAYTTSGNLSGKNVASGAAASGTSFCFTVTPDQTQYAGASAWSFGQNGLVKGTTCP